MTHSVKYNTVTKTVKALCTHEEIDRGDVIIKTTVFGDIIVRCDGLSNFLG